MLNQLAVALISSLLVAACASAPAQRDLVRLDATSKESAESSYRAMMRDRSESEQQQLAIAVLVLNMAGVNSASEAISTPELRSPSIVRIKDKVAGMTAQQIIEASKRNPSVRVVPGQ